MSSTFSVTQDQRCNEGTTDKQLHWLINHRQLIESVGSNEFLGEFIRRLLRYWSPFKKRA
jgi:hypothetical protein